MTAVRVESVEPPLSSEMTALLGDMHSRCFAQVAGGVWSAHAIRTIVETAGAKCWLSHATNRPGGLLLARIAGDDGEILTFGVLPEMRRGGHGTALMQAAAGWARAAGLERLVLEVAVPNAVARTFYGRCGFIGAGRRPGYYRTPSGREDALVLTAATAEVLNETHRISAGLDKGDE